MNESVWDVRKYGLNGFCWNMYYGLDMLSSLFRVMFSVISLCMLCKLVIVEEVDVFWNVFYVGGYSSMDMCLLCIEVV